MFQQILVQGKVLATGVVTDGDDNHAPFSNSLGTVKDLRKPVLLEDVAAAEAFISAAEVVVVGFFKRKATSGRLFVLFQVDNKRQDLETGDAEGLDANKLSRFVRVNELHWVTEYNPMTAIGLFESAIETHLLLFTNKSSPMHAERMDKYREAAMLFQGKILFILVDILAKGNERVMSYFHLKKSQLPAVAAYHTPDEEQDVLPLDDVSVEIIKDFCNGFLQRLQEVSIWSQFLNDSFAAW
ncbi:hypothetical protein JD844_028195 [Phrynosoma platyrhinos]|uniref:Endoplasmic reticulum resident protein 27 n=1 Tax=Phrynosoma platyrhinos TaxID=52577 RepID=A0ABQ7SHJ9_PHRPL|nr:hypothetical protein JD844_028195 [Phrynosoma platyrhinos]